jgi:peptide/nickel transport system substrate-binding protein
MLVLVFGGCHSPDEHSRETRIFRYNEPGGITSLDPAFARSPENTWAVHQLYSCLVQLDTTLGVQPCVARKWSLTPDGRRYTFLLRRDVWFHRDACFGAAGTRKLTAHDVAFSLNRLRNPQLAAPGAWILAELDSINGVEAANDTTLILRLTKPFAPFLSMLSHPYCSVLAPEAEQKYGKDLRSHPVGTGPFLLKQWAEGEKMVMRRHTQYFEWENGRRLPHLEAVSISFIRDRQTAYLEFLKGTFDMMSGLDGSYKDDLLDDKGTLMPKHAKNLRMHRMPYLKTDYLGVVIDAPGVLQKTAVRQALNMAIDKARLVQYLRNGIGQPAWYGLVPTALRKGFHDAMPTWGHEPEKARKLLKTAGVTAANALTLYTTSSAQEVPEFVQRQLQEIGMECKVEVMIPSVLNERVAKGDLAFFRKNWVGDYADAENFLALTLGSNRAPEGPNYSHFNHPHFNRMYREAVSEANSEKRLRLYARMDSLVATELPVIPLYYDEAVVFYHPNVSGWRFNSMNLLELKTVRKGS